MSGMDPTFSVFSVQNSHLIIPMLGYVTDEYGHGTWLLWLVVAYDNSEASGL